MEALDLAQAEAKGEFPLSFRGGGQGVGALRNSPTPLSSTELPLP